MKPTLRGLDAVNDLVESGQPAGLDAANISMLDDDQGNALGCDIF